MRVVYLLTASMPGVMPRLKWEKRDSGALALVIPSDLAGLYGERPESAGWRSLPGFPAASWNSRVG